MDWDRYWTDAGRARPGLYSRLAEFYRGQIISRAAAHILQARFPDAPGRHYLHAGCGSGGSDRRLRWQHARVHALDLSMTGLQLNRARRMPFAQWHVCGDLFRLPYQDRTIDGIFNFGVMEHFHEPQIDRILAEFRRVLKPGGAVVLFWPPAFGLSVIVIGAFLRIVNRVRAVPLQFYPDEVSRVRSFGWARAVMARNGFRTRRCLFGWRDLFTFVVVVAQPAGGQAETGMAQARVLHAGA